jgi:SAM-dependent methyltransferase
LKDDRRGLKGAGAHLVRRVLRTRLAQRVLPHMFVKHRVVPFLVEQSSTKYDAEKFFDSFFDHNVKAEGALSDEGTLGFDVGRIDSRYHYNCTENAIIESLLDVPLREPDVLDIGPGSGHWLGFYLDVYGAKSVVGLELSGSAVAQLREKFDGNERVQIQHGDLSEPGLDLGRQFDIINAIGVIFHIVEDALWEAAILNAARHLKPGGRMVVGGQFGRLTSNVQFHATDEFKSTDEMSGDSYLVNKRIRSLSHWRALALKAGLEVHRVHKTRKIRHFFQVENNVLVLTKPQ